MDFAKQRDTPELRALLKDVAPLSDYHVNCIQGSGNKWKTLRVKSTKKCLDRSKYLVNISYRCHHNTRYEDTRNAAAIRTQKPLKRFKNTCCPFVCNFKILKEQTDGYPCTFYIEWSHNHPIHCLEAVSFKNVSLKTKESLNALFAKGLSPSGAYSEFIRDLR